MLVEISFEPIEFRVEHRGGVEMPAIGGLSLDGAARAFDQAIGPWMIGLGQAVSIVPEPAALGQQMDLGRTSAGAEPPSRLTRLGHNR